MNNLEKAKKLLKDNNYTCVLCNGQTVYTSCSKGISPMLDFISEGISLENFSVADTIVGKAAALLFVYAGVTEVYGKVMSRSGEEIFKKYGIKYSYSELTDRIINRKGDGICPMEETVQNIFNPEQAFKAILDKRNELQKGN